MKKRILVVDIGGSNVKLMISAEEKRRKFPSGPKLGPDDAIAGIKELAADWDYDAVSIGFPAPVRDGVIVGDKPKHLGNGWKEFDFAKALGRPAKVINDAALQALGSHQGEGRTLFLGLGTGLGSALVWEGFVLSLELGDLPYVDHEIIEAKIGDVGLEKLGKKDWRKEALYVVAQLKSSFIADRVVVGGGNADLLKELPDGVELGSNRNAYPGGVRLWETNAKGEPKWRVL